MSDEHDPEWSIESVQKVEIVSNLRAHTVSTASRSNSGRSIGTQSSDELQTVQSSDIQGLSSLPNTISNHASSEALLQVGPKS